MRKVTCERPAARSPKRLQGISRKAANVTGWISLAARCVSDRAAPRRSLAVAQQAAAQSQRFEGRDRAKNSLPKFPVSRTGESSRSPGVKIDLVAGGCPGATIRRRKPSDRDEFRSRAGSQSSMRRTDVSASHSGHSRRKTASSVRPDSPTKYSRDAVCRIPEDRP